MVSFTGMELGLIFMVDELLDFRPGDISWLFVAIGLTSIIVQGGLVRRMSVKVSDRSFTVAGLILFTAGMLLLAAIAIYPASWLAFVGAIVVSLGFACVFPATSSWVSKLAPADQQGAAMGRIRSLGALARIVGPLGCAAMYFAFGAPVALIVLAAFLVIPLILTTAVIATPQLAEDTGGGPELGAVSS
jgi:MFS family permease